MIKNLKTRAAALALAATMPFALTGCGSIEMAPEEEYDIVQPVGDQENFSGLKQELDVPGEQFKLIANYACDDSSKREWRITSDKFLYIDMHTQGLPEGTEVYIDNIHIDTSIKSKYAAMDGIIQDSMDDHVHSSQLIGFNISDTDYYYGVNAIEGCNDTFIRGTAYGRRGYYSSEITEKRYTESDYLSFGVYANKIQIVVDLLVKGPEDKDFRNISISTDFIVPVNQTVNYENIQDEVVTETYQKTK